MRADKHVNVCVCVPACLLWLPMRFINRKQQPAQHGGQVNVEIRLTNSRSFMGETEIRISAWFKIKQMNDEGRKENQVWRGGKRGGSKGLKRGSVRCSDRRSRSDIHTQELQIDMGVCIKPFL